MALARDFSFLYSYSVKVVRLHLFSRLCFFVTGLEETEDVLLDVLNI